MSAVRLAYKQLKNNILLQTSQITGKTLSRPLRISIEPTKRCNARCIMCPCWKVKNDYISSEDIIAKLKELKSWLGSDFYVSMAGGEVFIFKGIFDIIEFCTRNQIYPMITTNGMKFSKPVLDRVISSKLSYIAVSLDSHIPEVHDSIRGVKGLFEKVVNGIHYLSENADLPIGISSVLMKPNADHFPESVRYFLSLPVDRYLFQPLQIWDGQNNYKAWPESDLWINDLETIKKNAEELNAIRRSDPRFFNTKQDIDDLYTYFSNPSRLADIQKRRCTLGFEKIVIDPKGDIYLGCTEFPPVGNIKTDSLIDAWFSEKAAVVRSKMLGCQMPCTNNGSKQVRLQQKVKKFMVLMNAGFTSRSLDVNETKKLA